MSQSIKEQQNKIGIIQALSIEDNVTLRVRNLGLFSQFSLKQKLVN